MAVETLGSGGEFEHILSEIGNLKSKINNFTEQVYKQPEKQQPEDKKEELEKKRYLRGLGLTMENFLLRMILMK